MGDLDADRWNAWLAVNYKKNEILTGRDRDFTSSFQPERGLSPDTRVILISGTQEAAIREQALQSGACAYLPKPFDDDTFLNAVRDALATAGC